MNDAYKKGQEAYQNGEDRDANPYGMSHSLYLSWDWGWTDERDRQHTIDLLNAPRNEEEVA